MFLFFDPTAPPRSPTFRKNNEDQASETFFYGGRTSFRENIVRWTAGPHTRRLSLINVTALLGVWSFAQAERQKRFMEEVVDWGNCP